MLTRGACSAIDPARDRFTLALGAGRWPSLDEHARRAPSTAARRGGGAPLVRRRHDRLWLGTRDAPGLAVLDLRTGHLARYRHRPDDPMSAPNSPTITFFEDRAGGVWVSTYQGAPARDPAEHPLPAPLRPYPRPQHPARPRPAGPPPRERLLRADVPARASRHLRAPPRLHRRDARSVPSSLRGRRRRALGGDVCVGRGAEGSTACGPDGTHARYTQTSAPRLPPPRLFSASSTKTREGRLWVGTEGGLVRYDRRPTASCACTRRTTTDRPSARRRSGP